MAKPPTKHIPRGRDYTEPLRSKLPALEQNVLKLRAMNMILVMFYAEDLKRSVLGIKKELSGPPTKPPKHPVDEALKSLVADGAITADEKEEIVSLIDFRNFIGHQVHHLLSDVGGRWAHNNGDYRPKGIPEYDGTAVTRLRHFRKRLGGLYRTHHYIVTVSFAPLAFEAAEKTYLLEIKRLHRKVSRLMEVRRAQINKVNAELHLAGAGLLEDALGHPAMRHQTEAGEGRLTKRGAETVYKLFDLGKSTMAVAHLTRLSLDAVRKRQKMWRAQKGPSR